MDCREARPPQPWHDRVLIVADDGPPEAALGEDYNALADEVARALPPRMTIQRVTLGRGSYPTADSVRSSVASALGSGRALLGYVGEGQRLQWADEGVWRVEDILPLDNSNLTVSLELTGLTGYFADRFKVSWRGYRESRFDDIDAEVFQGPGNL